MCVSGKSDSALNVGLDDLLNADRQGKWYLVGSAWQGAGTASTKTETMNSGQYLYMMSWLCIFIPVAEHGLRYGYSTGNAIEENSSVFSLIRMR